MTDHLESQFQVVEAQPFFAVDGPESSEVFVNCVTLVRVNQVVEREDVRPGHLLLQGFGVVAFLGEPIIFLGKVLNSGNSEKLS